MKENKYWKISISEVEYQVDVLKLGMEIGTFQHP